MYVQFKQGFIEADKWDGSPIPDENQQKLVNFISDKSGGEVIVVRSREDSTLTWMLAQMFNLGKPVCTGWKIQNVVFVTPDWDYEYRIYVSKKQFALLLGSVVTELDYRNFKSWTKKESSKARQKLAADIWQAGYSANAYDLQARQERLSRTYAKHEKK